MLEVHRGMVLSFVRLIKHMNKVVGFLIAVLLLSGFGVSLSDCVRVFKFVVSLRRVEDSHVSPAAL